VRVRLPFLAPSTDSIHRSFYSLQGQRALHQDARRGVDGLDLAAVADDHHFPRTIWKRCRCSAVRVYFVRPAIVVGANDATETQCEGAGSVSPSIKGESTRGSQWGKTHPLTAVVL
jgi:hypothetical protein